MILTGTTMTDRPTNHQRWMYLSNAGGSPEWNATVGASFLVSLFDLLRYYSNKDYDSA